MFSWMQKKLNGKNGSKKGLSSDTPFNKNVLGERCREEFIDWPHGFLAIGTLGNNNCLKENVDERSNLEEENPSSSQENLTPEEVGQLQKELNLLDSDYLDNCMAILEVDRSNGTDESSEGSKNKGSRQLQRSNSAINKKSLSFLLKKMFVCRSGFAPAPPLNLKDPLPESRIEKILRAILHKKIHPQSSSPKVSARKYLKNRSQISNSGNENDETNEEVEAEYGSRWVKTDSEYIVLEI